MEIDFEAPEVKAVLDKKLDELTTGLKSKRDELLSKNSQLSEQVKTLNNLGGEEGIRKLKEFQDRISKDEELRLLSEGKYDQVIERRTAPARQQAEQLAAQLKQARQERQDIEGRYQSSILDNGVAVRLNDLQDGALSIAQQLARQYLQANGNGSIEPRPDAQAWNGKAVNADTFKDFLLERHPYLFKPSTGGAGTPSTSAPAGGKTMRRADYDAMSLPEQGKAIRSGTKVID